MAVKRLKRKATGVDFAALAHEFLEVVGKVLMAWKGRVTERRKAALNAQGHTRPVEQDRGLIPFAVQAYGIENIDQPNRPLEGHGMKADQRFLARLGLHVFENLLFVIDEKIAVFMFFHGYCGHV